MADSQNSAPERLQMRRQFLAWIPSGTWRQIRAEAARYDPLETGGILVGYWATESEVVITRSISAGPRAIHKAYKFAPDQQHQEGELARVYRDSGGVETYLGDWHTHPGQGTPHPSGKDRSTLKRIAATPEARAPIALTMIVGGSGGDWRIGIWAGYLEPWFGFWDKLAVAECGLNHF
jgi:integrative and conjugative element protein (TIGR02256 family)